MKSIFVVSILFCAFAQATFAGPLEPSAAHVCVLDYTASTGQVVVSCDGGEAIVRNYDSHITPSVALSGQLTFLLSRGMKIVNCLTDDKVQRCYLAK